MQFTNEDLKNLLILIAKAPINGGEATTVALLQQKINRLLAPAPVDPKEGETEETNADDNGKG